MKVAFSNVINYLVLKKILFPTSGELGLELKLKNAPSTPQCADQTTLTPGDVSKMTSCNGACFKFKFQEKGKLVLFENLVLQRVVLCVLCCAVCRVYDLSMKRETRPCRVITRMPYTRRRQYWKKSRKSYGSMKL